MNVANVTTKIPHLIGGMDSCITNEVSKLVRIQIGLGVDFIERRSSDLCAEKSLFHCSGLKIMLDFISMFGQVTVVYTMSALGEREEVSERCQKFGFSDPHDHHDHLTNINPSLTVLMPPLLMNSRV
jgi:hypothetical protein